MSEIPFAGQLTQRDFDQIQRLGLRGIRWIIIVAVLLVVVWNLGVIGPRELLAHPGRTAYTWGPFLLVVPAVGFGLRVAFRRQFQTNKVLQAPVNGVVSDEAIVWSVEGLSSMRVPWQLLLKYRASNSLVLVYQSVNQTFYFPRHYFSSQSAWDSFREMVSRKLPRK
jgi:hypothetical protein